MKHTVKKGEKKKTRQLLISKQEKKMGKEIRSSRVRPRALSRKEKKNKMCKKIEEKINSLLPFSELELRYFFSCLKE